MIFTSEPHVFSPCEESPLALNGKDSLHCSRQRAEERASTVAGTEVQSSWFKVQKKKGISSTLNF